MDAKVQPGKLQFMDVAAPSCDLQRRLVRHVHIKRISVTGVIVNLSLFRLPYFSPFHFQRGCLI